MARGRGAAAALGAIVASATKLKLKQGGNASRRQSPSWQKDAFAYYDSLGEIWYSAQFYSRTLSKLVLKPQLLNDQDDPEDTDDPAAWEVLDRMQDPAGGRRELQGQYGKLRFLIGEMYLFCHLDEETGQEIWEILSPFELEFDGRVYTRKTTPKDEGRKYLDAGADQLDPTGDATATGWRLWVKHPLFSGLADSPMRAVLDECEELLLLSQGVRAGARSRLQGNGILTIPSEISPAPTGKPGAPADDNAQNDQFFSDLTEAMVTPIGDEGSASAVVPMLVRGQAELLKYITHIPLYRPDQIKETRAERRDCIERIALGLDLPPEILLGVTDANHWTAWQIDEDAWKAHVQPVADAMVADLTNSYFRPSLREMGHANWDRLVIGYDESDVVRRPNKSGDAIRLFDRMELSGEKLRKEAGFEEDDAPTPQEIADRLERAAAMGKGAQETPPRNDAPVPRGDSKPGKGAPDEAAAARIETAAELMIARSRHVAGSRIRTRLQRERDWKQLVAHVPNDLVAYTVYQNLGHLPASLGAPDALVAGGGEMYLSRLERWGMSRPHAEQLVRACEEAARDTLLDPEAGPLSEEILKLAAMAMAVAPA